MAPPELQFIHQIWNGSPSQLGCIAWFASGTIGWTLVDRQSLEFSEPEICGGKMTAACTHTAFCVAKLLSAKSPGDGRISFDLDWSDGSNDPIVADQLENVFSQVNKVFLVRVDLADNTGHSFVVTSYPNVSQGVCCGLYMSYATAVGEGGYTLSEFLNGALKFAPKMNQDIPMTGFIQAFAMLLKTNVSKDEFRETWKTLFGCGPGNCTQLKQVGASHLCSE